MSTATDGDQSLAQKQAAGLRALADMIETNPELSQYFRYTGINQMLVSVSGETTATTQIMAAFIRAAKAHGAKIGKSAESKYFNVDITWGPVGIQVYAPREDVCERRVTGTETVTKSVPDPDVLATVPMVEVTETVETVEWVCKPLLATVDNTVESVNG